jgi:hypothetical protein
MRKSVFVVRLDFLLETETADDGSNWPFEVATDGVVVPDGPPMPSNALRSATLVDALRERADRAGVPLGTCTLGMGELREDCLVESAPAEEAIHSAVHKSSLLPCSNSPLCSAVSADHSDSKEERRSPASIRAAACMSAFLATSSTTAPMSRGSVSGVIGG